MPITEETRDEPKRTLQGMEVHTSWARHYRTRENDRFYQLAFDLIANVFGPPDDEPVVDVGCGSGTKSLLLARRGYRVRALDFSEAILETARAAASAADLGDAIDFASGDLTALALETGSVRRVLCWGVLMHVPAVAQAIAELARVVSPGGILVVSEGNFRSIQATALRWLKRLLRRERAEVVRTPAGIEFWEETSDGRLMTRQADVPWLIAEFGKHGLRLEGRYAGQFSELYTSVPWQPVRRVIHLTNNGWFRWVRFGGPAFGNLLVLRRPR